MLKLLQMNLAQSSKPSVSPLEDQEGGPVARDPHRPAARDPQS